MIGVLAENQTVPLYVPLLGAAWGLYCWFTGVRHLVRDPRGEIRRIAEARARSRLLHPFGGGDVEREFETQWRLRWIGFVAIGGYVLAVVWQFVLAFWG